MLEAADIERIQKEHPESLALGIHRRHIRDHMIDLLIKMSVAEPEQMRGLYDEMTRAVADLGDHVESVEALFKEQRRKSRG